MSNLHDELLSLKMAAEKMPNPSKIGDVLKLVSKGAPYDRLFFEKLNDPAWLSVLDQHGYFINLPKGTKTDSGAMMYPYHMPLFGLARLAPVAPHAVTSILAKLDVPENPTVGDQILRCVSSILEPSCIPVLHSLLVKLGDKSNRSSWVWVHELIKNWIDIKAFHDVWELQQVDEISLAKLTPEFPLQIATIVFNALARFAKSERNTDAGDKTSKEFEIEAYFGENTSPAYWLEDFKSDSNYREIEGTLARRLYVSAEEIYKKGNIHEIDLLDQLLTSNSWTLFHRLRCKLYASFPDLSLTRARKVVVERIPYLNRFEFEYTHELAELIQVHSKKYGEAFLSKSEVEDMFEIIMRGPIEKFNDTSDNHFKNVFRRKQLWPFSSLLQGEQLAAFEALCPDSNKINFDAYKAFPSSGGEAHFVQSVPPREAVNLAGRSDHDLWEMLNDWQPRERDYSSAKWWVQEDYGALAKEFVKVVESNPQRFLPQTQWWENLKRPEPLFETLNRAIERIKDKKTDSSAEDWANWFGIAQWIVSQSAIAISDDAIKKQNASRKQNDWYWPRIVVCSFLTAAIQSGCAAVNDHNIALEQLLRMLVEAPDERLQTKDEDQYQDWLTTAINSVRGHAVEGILTLALKQNNAKEPIQPWIFQLICSRLEMPEESPAIFAIVGSKLRLCVYLFKGSLKDTHSLFFPTDRQHQKRAAMVSHFCYDAPMTGVVEAFPELLNDALSTMAAMLAEAKDDDSKQKPQDFASQLGIHAAFYYWNNAFRDEQEGEAVLNRYFNLASPKTREIVINEIGRIFEKAPEINDPESKKRFLKVMQLWERRFAQIKACLTKEPSSLPNYEGELGQSLDWLNCECFPFKWRFDYAMKAISHLQKVPEVFRLLETLQTWNKVYPERLIEALEILKSFLEKPSDQLRWSIQTKKLQPMLTRGLNSDQHVTKVNAESCRDLLLKMGFFDFLEI